MTSSVIRKCALAALCGAAIIGFGQSAQAATWNIVGGVAPTGAATYDTDPDHNNVINSPLSGNSVIDPSAGATILQAAQLQANFSTTSYIVQYTYVGSESANIIDFAAPGVTVTGVVGFAETNANNQCVGCGYIPLQPGPIAMGTSPDQTSLLAAFFFRDQSDGSGVVNGLNPGDNVGQPNFLISYATLVGTNLVLSAAPSDWVVIGFNDTGSSDDNHDDMTVALHILESGREDGVPIPGALPLFASVLGGGYLFRRLRNRRQAKAAA